MPVKELILPELGKVKLYKRRGAKAIKITITNDDHVRISLPMWLPYRAGVNFAINKHDWITKHRKTPLALSNGARVGKAHTLVITSSGNYTKVITRVTKYDVRINIPSDLTHTIPAVQAVIKTAAQRALKKEAEVLLPTRLDQLAKNHDYNYTGLAVKKMSSRWGSCSHQGYISLNIFLMQLDWPLIDYVILHELTHTKHLHHGKEFWTQLKKTLPAVDELRQELKTRQPSF